MRMLKSLKEFEKQANCLNSDELKNVSGGKNVYYTETTCRYGRDDQARMCQEYRHDGTQWVKWHSAYQVSFCYE